jgi:magnesium transporter
MLRRYEPASRALVDAGELPAEGWVHVSAPGDDELALLAARGVPRAFVTHALDVNEVSRVLRQDGATLVVVRAPRRDDGDGDGDGELPYRSEPIGLVLVGGLVVTIARGEPELLGELAATSEIDPRRPMRLLLSLVMRVAERFVEHVGAIEGVVNELEGRLRASLANEEVLELLKYQKGLVHFTTALRSNRIMLERIVGDPHFDLDPGERELAEEVMVELHQAIAMARVAADILANMMDAFASIISNNLNVVMKVLTAVTVVLTPPMLIASLYGMNVALPGQTSPLAFPGLLALCAALSALVASFLWRRRWL